MIFSLIKKQLLLAVRDRQNITLLLAMPLVLIAIIKFSVADMVSPEAPTIDAKVGIVEQSNEVEEMKRLQDELLALPLPEEAKQEIETNVAQFQPIQMLKENVLGSEELKDMIKLESIAPEELEQAKKDETYDAIIEVPENFSFQLMKSAFANEAEVPKLNLYVNDGEFNSKIVHDILVVYEDQVNTNMALNKYGMEDVVVTAEEVTGTIQTIDEQIPVSGTFYYVIGMSMMFVLYISSTIGYYAFDEKRIHVFDRIILANISKWTYFIAILLSGALLAFAQLMILFGVSAVAFGTTWPNLWQFFLVTLFICLAVGCLAALITALNYRFNTDSASNLFSNVIISLFALLGGSFFPFSEYSDLFAFIGNLTPNGSGLTAYLTSAQGYGISEIWPHLAYLGGFMVLVLVAAALVIPQRGQEA
ncbi:ABC transporter permease [Salirhabdus sp. Marseille-P4669]|uniref:ABC transporter permease n=1 Tax=Salirhabdus sp. Marseille-P4669 TaxID=2042310 RepID=UPI000C7E59F8|nr:ABC transporter permease [Salirhabdus sp. Marseille-P4669]